MGFAGSFVILFVLRLAVGALEAPAYPINNRVVTTWFPERERATAIGFYTSGQFVGLAFLTPVLAWLQHHYGWHMVFVSTGLLGIVWGVLWFMIYREPRQFKGANAAEIELIQQGGGVVDLDRRAREKKAPFSWNDLGLVMSKRKLWGVYLGQFCLTSTLWFFLTWFPTYLVKYRGMDFIKSGFLASVPFLAAFIGVLCSGVLSDFLIRRGATVGLARKLPIILGLLISTSMIGANFTDSTPWVIFFLAVAFFGNGLASITWSLVSTLAPVRLLGLTGGVFNFVGNLSSICTPIVIGFLVTKDSFAPAIVYVSSLALLGACHTSCWWARWSGSKLDAAAVFSVVLGAPCGRSFFSPRERLPGACLPTAPDQARLAQKRLRQMHPETATHQDQVVVEIVARVMQRGSFARPDVDVAPRHPLRHEREIVGRHYRRMIRDAVLPKCRSATSRASRAGSSAFTSTG